jgi:hypothetical protein
MAILYVAVLYSTVDVEYFYKIFGKIFPIPLVQCKNIDNGHTLLNKNHMCDASGPLFVSDFTQLGYRVNLHHIEFT